MSDKKNYYGIEIVENQEPTEAQIRELMRAASRDYYEAQEELRVVSYGRQPTGYDSWEHYRNRVV